MVVVFTSVADGGIMQLANQITHSLGNLGHVCKLYVPDGSLRFCAEDLLESVVQYNTPKTVNPWDRELKALAKEIEALEPELVVAVDDAIRSNILLSLLRKRIRRIIFVHDVTPHPHNQSWRGAIVERIRCIYRISAFSAAEKVVLLSENSKQRFAKRYRRFRQKSVLLPLGAHIVPATEQMPPELRELGSDGFALFFGRIDKYKGVERLIEAHEAAGTDADYKLHLVIAGKNLLGKPLPINDCAAITAITRYISDGEMLWLFSHCKFVVLPYYEASQSGVLPISYKYGKPVVVSDIPGLMELVEQGKTGEIFKNQEELKEILLRLAKALPVEMSKEAIQTFYDEVYDWEKNLDVVIRK